MTMIVLEWWWWEYCFFLKEMRSHYRILSSGVTWHDVGVNRIISACFVKRLQGSRAEQGDLLGGCCQIQARRLWLRPGWWQQGGGEWSDLAYVLKRLDSVHWRTRYQRWEERNKQWLQRVLAWAARRIKLQFTEMGEDHGGSRSRKAGSSVLVTLNLSCLLIIQNRQLDNSLGSGS